MIRAVLFDLDGVLTDTERLGSQMINAACRLQGFSLSEDEWKWKGSGDNRGYVKKIEPCWYYFEASY